MHLPFAFELCAFFVGLLFGSFLNVCIARLPEHESIVKPRSRCPQCMRSIRWHDNIPVLSWIALRRRCRDCGTKISWSYPAVELATGLWFAAAAVNLVDFLQHREQVSGVVTTVSYSGYFDFTAFLILGFLHIGLLVMDWQTHTLPDAFTLTGCGLGFFLICVEAIFLAPGQDDILNPGHGFRMSSPGSMASQGNVFITGPEHLVFGRLLAIVGAAALPWLIRVAYRLLRGEHGLGLGDVKLMAMIAAFLGFWPAILAFFLGCVFILPYALFLLVSKRANRGTALPFGAFLCAGGLVAALLGAPMIAWYSTML